MGPAVCLAGILAPLMVVGITSILAKLTGPFLTRLLPYTITLGIAMVALLYSVKLTRMAIQFGRGEGLAVSDLLSCLIPMASAVGTAWFMSTLL